MASKNILSSEETEELKSLRRLQKSNQFMTQEQFDRLGQLAKYQFTSCRSNCDQGDYRKGGKCDKQGCWSSPHEA